MVNRDVFPPYNLPNEAIPWGREVQKRVIAGENSEVQLTQKVDNGLRATAGQLSALAEQISDLRGRVSYTAPVNPSEVFNSSGQKALGPSLVITLTETRVVKLTGFSQAGLFLASGSFASSFHLSFRVNDSVLPAESVARGFAANQTANTLIQFSLNSSALVTLPAGEHEISLDGLASMTTAGTTTLTNLHLFADVLQVVQ